MQGEVSVGNKRFAVGTVDTGIERPKQKSWIKSTHVENFAACASCWARYLCGGGCRLQSHLLSGNIQNPNPVACTLIRREYEVAMSSCLEIAGEDEDLLRDRYAEVS